MNSKFRAQRSSYMSMFRLEGKTALVTGGIGILGRHFCKGLAEAGANVIVVDLDPATVKDFAYELNAEFGTRSLGVACDITQLEQIESMHREVLSEFGHIDILHNNAATKTDHPEDFFIQTEEFPLEVWRKIMAVNVDGLFLIAQRIGGRMASSGKGGSIIQTSSIYGIMAPDQRIYEGSSYMGMTINTPAVYSASKAAVVGLTRYLAALWGDKKVRVNTLVPAGVQSGQNETFVSRYSNRVPMGRMARADEMVGAVIYLASDASSYVTGQTLVVDGGLSVW